MLNSRLFCHPKKKPHIYCVHSHFLLPPAPGNQKSAFCLSNLPVWLLHVNGIIHVAFCVWLLSLRAVFSRFRADVFWYILFNIFRDLFFLEILMEWVIFTSEWCQQKHFGRCGHYYIWQWSVNVIHNIITFLMLNNFWFPGECLTRPWYIIFLSFF